MMSVIVVVHPVGSAVPNVFLNDTKNVRHSRTYEDDCYAGVSRPTSGSNSSALALAGSVVWIG